MWQTLFFLFQGLDLLQRASSLREEVQQLETEGLQKIESAVAGLEVEGLYRLLSEAISHSPMSSIPPQPKRCHHTPTATISKLSPQVPEEAAPEAYTPVVREVELAPEAPFSAVSQALEVAIPAYMAPLHLQLGASRGFISAGWRDTVRGHQPHGLQFVHMCAETIWE